MDCNLNEAKNVEEINHIHSNNTDFTLETHLGKATRNGLCLALFMLRNDYK
jgi:hypothetical protein